MAGLLETRIRRTSAAARASKQIADDDREARDNAICEADATGITMREIQRWTGDPANNVPSLSFSQVQRICYTGQAARDAWIESNVMAG